LEAVPAARIANPRRISPHGMTLAEWDAPERHSTVKPYKGKTMKRIFSQFGCGALICAAAILSTQTVNAADASGAPDYRPFTLGLEAASTGFGGSANWRFTEHFGARAGLNYFSNSKTGNEIEGITYNTDLRLMSEPLAVDIYPWAKSSFRVTVGILINQNQLTGVAPRDPVAGRTFLPIGDNGTLYDSAAIGDLNMKIEQWPVCPYLSIGGNIYFDKARHWSVSGELGVAYTGSPDVTLSTGNAGSVPQQDLDAEAKQLEDAAKKYQFYPIIRVSLNYSF
jgi:hypothetical protein